ncbi:MAG: hypothetical protein IT204_08255 [Fimbriimonadaceae bacterium]|nr:hypothetical protein [Fimbriimonadaceae bacterium]
MRQARRVHRGKLQDRRAQQWLLQSAVMMLAFVGASGLLQNTLDITAKSRQVAVRIATDEARLAQLKVANANLRDELIYDGSKGGVLGGVRRLGYVRPGEIRLMVAPAD